MFVSSLFNITQITGKQQGFTLLELLLVIGLLAMLAGTALLGYEDVQTQSQYDATRHEMAEIRQALLQFRHDSGTKSFPGQGVYDCDDDPNANSSTPNTNLNFPPVLSGATASEKLAWCRNSANFWMLFEDLTGNGWNEDTHRGWHGPYIRNKQQFIVDNNGHDVSVIHDPYGQPYELHNLDQDASASIVSGGENKQIVAPSGCTPNEDDLVLCLLR